MKETALQVDIARRWWLAASAGGAAAGLAGWSPASLAQAKPLPPVACQPVSSPSLAARIPARGTPLATRS